MKFYNMLYILFLINLILLSICLIVWIIKQFHNKEIKQRFNNAVVRSIQKKLSNTVPDGMVLKIDNKKIEEDAQKEQQEKWYGK